jgi:hypothetical protein
MTCLQQRAKTLNSQVKIYNKGIDKYIESIKYYNKIKKNTIKIKTGVNRLHTPPLNPRCLLSTLVCMYVCMHTALSFI